MSSQPKNLSMAQVLICGAAIVTLSMGIRHGFGLWLQPITQDQGWPRQTFALAIAIQNLSWGLCGIFAGMAADRLGAFKVLLGGALLYALGLAGMALSTSPLGFALTTGVLIGAAQAGTTYAVICGGLVRAVPDGASGRTADCPAGLEGSLVGPEPDGVDDRAPGLRPA